MQPMQTFDVLIIGGGLAGSAAAIHLVSKGYRVALIERETLAHHKVCGEFLSPETLPYLQELGIDLDLLKASSLHTYSFYSKHFQTQGLFEFPARGLSRHVLDEACLEKAHQLGCFLLRGERIESFEKDASQNF